MSTHNVTLTVLDQDDDPVEGLVLELRNTGTLYLVGTMTTDSSGEVLFPDVEGGSYVVMGSTTGVRLPRTPITVSGAADISLSVTASVFGTVTPTPTAFCTVFGFIQVEVGGEVDVYATVTASAVNGDGSGVNPRHQNFPSYSFAVPVREGRWEMDLPQGARCTLSIPSTLFTKTFTVPSLPLAAMADIHEILSSTPFNSSSSLS
jgi:hypothetical protein